MSEGLIEAVADEREELSEIQITARLTAQFRIWDAMKDLGYTPTPEAVKVIRAAAFGGLRDAVTDAALREQPSEASPAEDWWKPEPGDPFWMLEVRIGFDNAGAWLKNKHTCLTTREATKALRFPSQWSADCMRRSLPIHEHGRFMPTEHLWFSQEPSEASPASDAVERPSLISEGYAVLREACRADQRKAETWPRISPGEARQVVADLRAARAYIAALEDKTDG